MTRWLAIAVLLVLAYVGVSRRHLSETETATGSAIPEAAVAASEDVAAAFRNHASNVQVTGDGTVVRVLPDDTDGDRHQRFILRVPSGQTVLVAHNIDLAQRMSVSAGDTVEFSGEYVWNAQGGLLHWTHRDPQGHHNAGWLKHDGRVYQ